MVIFFLYDFEYFFLSCVSGNAEFNSHVSTSYFAIGKYLAKILPLLLSGVITPVWRISCLREAETGVSKCFLPAFLWVNLPVAVLRKRFFPPAWFFNFGM